MKRHVLFVDDEPRVLAGLERMLRGQRDQWDLAFVTSADEALGELAGAEIDAVVSDVTMPGKDGFVLLDRIRKTPETADVPVIILTGHSDSGTKRRALDLGATDLLNKPVDPQELIARLRNALRLKEHQDQLKAQNVVLERKVAERTAELVDSRLDIIWRLGKAAEHRDEDTGNHVVRVGCYCRLLAERYGAKRDFVEMLFVASPLHDIGKIGIPDAILLKRGPLSSEEWEVMKQHCVIGAEILREDSKLMTTFLRWSAHGGPGRNRPASNPLLSMASAIALAHHEHWDGSGYPAGLAGEEIPLAARIVAISDVYDALCFARPYKPALSEAEALRIIRGEVGRQFDPGVYAAFQESLSELRAIRTELRDEPCSLATTGCAL